MKKIISILAISAFVLASCTEEYIKGVTDPNLVGTWQLIQVLADPGDGSGTFQDVDSDAEIVFAHDGSFTSNTALCRFSAQAGSSMSGSYLVEDKLLKPNDCASTNWQAGYGVDGNTLVINFTCREPCAQKYERVGKR